tara:strand:- start:1457 stop:1732 length:276 start_codon:yes stop_codon:yes gene_type:complete
MAREIFNEDQLLSLFQTTTRGKAQKENDFDLLTEVGQWFFIPFTDMTKSQKKHNYRPQAPCRLTAQGRKYRTIKGNYGHNEEEGIVVQRIK